MPLAVALASTLVVLLGLGAGAAYLVDSRSTRRRSLRPHPVLRGGRGLRSGLLRLLLWLLLWPLTLARFAERRAGLEATAVARSRRQVVARQGPATLWRYRLPEDAVEVARAPREQALPVLLVHSLISRSWVLDLLPGRSLIEALLRDGHDVLLLDWEEPGPAQADCGLATYVDLLAWAEEQACQSAGTEKVHVLGYSLGGTLALALHTTAGHGRAASLALLGSPVDTKAVGGIGRVLGSAAFPPRLLLDGHGLVPEAHVRTAFQLMRPRGTLTARRVRASRDQPWREGLGALSRWTWEQQAMSGALLFDLVDLYRDNALVSGTLSLGARADLRHLVGLPLLVVTAVRDHLVPPASTLALLSVPGLDVQAVQCTTGHVAMLAGSEAERVLYPSLRAWLAPDEP